MDEVKEELREVKDKIKAVEFLLPSYRIVDETERRNLVESTIDEAGSNEVQRFVRTYARYKEDKLQDQLNKLQDKENILLARGTGENICSV
jgi:hypothetical protein